ncbi:MAG: hypothetical protein ACYCQJ_05635 [Nitrososphaerales archaeon]
MLDEEKKEERVRFDFNGTILTSVMDSFSAQQKLFHAALQNVMDTSSLAAIAMQSVTRTFEGFSTYIQAYIRVLTVGLKNFKPPNEYDPAQFKLDPGFKNIVISEIELVMDEFAKSRFDFLSSRLRAGYDDYNKQEYQGALFSVLSVIDGMLGEFFVFHNDMHSFKEKRHASFDDKLTHFIKHYKNDELFVQTEDLKKVLSDFFEHRNQIMHGGRKAFFDENLSVICFGIFMLVFESILPIY